MNLTVKATLTAMLIVCAGHAQAEYCLNWSSFVSQHSGSSGHCWARESECNSYRASRPAGDYVGGCYYRPGQYPRTGEQKGGGTASGANEAAAQKQKLDAMKRQQEAAERQAFEKDQQQLLGSLKGAAPSEPARTILLKPLPPAGGAARSQLDCAARNKPEESWEQRAKDCAPVTPNVPEPSQPAAVKEEAPASQSKVPSQ